MSFAKQPKRRATAAAPGCGHLCSGARPVSTPAQLQRPSIPKLLTRAPAFAFRWERQKGEPRRATQNERQMRSADKTKRRGGHATSRTRAQACSHAGRSRIADGRFKEAPRKTKNKITPRETGAARTDERTPTRTTAAADVWARAMRPLCGEPKPPKQTEATRVTMTAAALH